MKLLELFNSLTKSILLEDRLDYLRTQFGDKVRNKFSVDATQGNRTRGISADTIFDALIKSDPTPQKKYVQWIIKLYLSGNLLLEDLYKVRAYLITFLAYFNQLPVEARDINRYKSLVDLATVLEPYEAKPANLRL